MGTLDQLVRGLLVLCHAALTTPVTQLLILVPQCGMVVTKYVCLHGTALLHAVAQQLWTLATTWGSSALPQTPAVTASELSSLTVRDFDPATEATRPPDSAFQGLQHVGYPFKPHFFTCHGLRVHFLDEQPAVAPAQGAPETLLLLHGNPTSSFLFRYMIPHFTAAGFRVVALDFIGFGKSDKLLKEEDMTAELHATTIVALLEHLGLTRVTVVAHDWGAIFLQWCLPWLPTQRIGRLVVLNAALPPHMLMRELGLANALLVAIWTASVALIGTLVPVSLTMKVMIPSLPLPAALGYGKPFPSPAHKAAVVRLPRLGMLSVMPSSTPAAVRRWGLVKALEAALPGVSDVLSNNVRNMARGEKARTWLRLHWMKPTLLLFGAPDPLFGSVQQRFTGLIYNAKALSYHQEPIIVEGAGHYLPETQPARTALEIIKFVASTRA